MELFINCSTIGLKSIPNQSTKRKLNWKNDNMRRVFQSENSFGLLVAEFLLQDPWGYWGQFYVLYFPSKPFPFLLHSETFPPSHTTHTEKGFFPLCNVRSESFFSSSCLSAFPKRYGFQHPYSKLLQAYLPGLRPGWSSGYTNAGLHVTSSGWVLGKEVWVACGLSFLPKYLGGKLLPHP